MTRTPNRHGGSLWLGAVVGLAIQVGVWMTTVLTATHVAGEYVPPLLPFALLASLLHVVAGAMFALVERTRRFGGGLLLGFGAGFLVSAGLCVGLRL